MPSSLKMVDKRVRCVDASKSQGQIVEGQVYDVYLESSEVYYLKGSGGWLRHRFEDVSQETTEPSIIVSAPTSASAPFDFDAYNGVRRK